MTASTLNPATASPTVPLTGAAQGGAVVPPCTEEGQILYCDGVGWALLNPGVTGQHLETNGIGAAPSWETTPDGQAFINFDLSRAIYPVAAQATPGSATSATNAPTIDFPQSVDRDVFFAGAMDEKYDGGTLVLGVYYFAETAIAGNVRWEGSFVRQRAGDLVTRAFAAAQFEVGAVPGVVDTITARSIQYTQVQADSIAAGDPFRLRLRRAGASGDDTMDDIARVIAVTLEEP